MALLCTQFALINDQRVAWLVRYLEGPALQAYNTLTDAQKKDFDEIKNLLTKTFPSDEARRAAASQLRHCHQQAHETVTKWIANIVYAMLDNAPQDEIERTLLRETMTRFRSEITTYLFEHDLDTYDKMCTLARRKEAHCLNFRLWFEHFHRIDWQ